jgi:hypothetical protein
MLLSEQAMMHIAGSFISTSPPKGPSKSSLAPVPTRCQSFSHPQTIKSSTKINVQKAHCQLSSQFCSGSVNGKDKAELSMQQQENANKNIPYSPPLTRST